MRRTPDKNGEERRSYRNNSNFTSHNNSNQSTSNNIQNQSSNGTMNREPNVNTLEIERLKRRPFRINGNGSVDEYRGVERSSQAGNHLQNRRTRLQRGRRKGA